MLESLKQWQPRIGGGLIILGMLFLSGSFMIGGSSAWIARMIAVVVLASGLQWLPRLEQWLSSRVYERLLIATSIGLALVWMLVMYSNA
jgi:hypothetical protein